jgi:hypothetical protein
MPRFQTYAGHLSVASTQEALAAIQNLTEPFLVIENPVDAQQAELADAPEAAAAIDGPDVHIDVLEARATRYFFKVTAQQPRWLFIADANYPGWKAFVDGNRVPVFSAQILGKAIGIPPGEHDVLVQFESNTFRWGFWITIATLCGSMLVLLRRSLGELVPTRLLNSGWLHRREPSRANRVLPPQSARSVCLPISARGPSARRRSSTAALMPHGS